MDFLIVYFQNEIEPKSINAAYWSNNCVTFQMLILTSSTVFFFLLFFLSVGKDKARMMLLKESLSWTMLTECHLYLNRANYVNDTLHIAHPWVRSFLVQL